jgi:hypothetical protein
VDLWYYLGDRIFEVPISLDLSNISDAEVAKKFIEKIGSKTSSFKAKIFVAGHKSPLQKRPPADRLR